MIPQVNTAVLDETCRTEQMCIVIFIQCLNQKFNYGEPQSVASRRINLKIRARFLLA